MPLSSTRLRDAIKTKLTVYGFDPNHEHAIIHEYAEAIAEAVIEEITANALVNGPVTVTSVSGVTTGAGVSGPGSGTLNNGTIT